MRASRIVGSVCLMLCILASNMGIAFATAFLFRDVGIIPGVYRKVAQSATVTPTTVTRLPTSTYATPPTFADLAGAVNTLTADSTFDYSIQLTFDVGTYGLNVYQGGSNATTITILWQSGSTQIVTLSCSSGLPTGAACNFNPASGYASYVTTLTITALPSTGVGTSGLTLTGTGGGVVRTAYFDLHVLPALTLDVEPTGEHGTDVVQLNAPLTFSGITGPPQPAGTPIMLQYSLDGGATWNSFITTLTNSTGGYSAVWYPPHAYIHLGVGGTYWLRATCADKTSPTTTRTIHLFDGHMLTNQTQVGIQVSGPDSTSGGSADTFDVLLTAKSDSLGYSYDAVATIWIEITGPAGYLYYDTALVNVHITRKLGVIARCQFIWQAPLTPGAYQVTVGLIPAGPGSLPGSSVDLPYPLAWILSISRSTITVA